MNKQLVIPGVVLAGGAALLAVVALRAPGGSPPEQISAGRELYAQHCASCHGKNLEGGPDWRVRKPDGRMPAPPHDDTGHTWHHPEDVLFGITKHGLVPPYAPAGYPSDMPAFKGKLSDDEIRAVLVFIESRWSPQVLAHRREMLGNRGR